MPHLTLLEKGSGKTHRVEGSEVLAGRDPACGLFLEGDEAKTVSARHARFFVDDGRWFVEDAGSRNGTYIGTRKVEPGTRHALSVGDVVGLGMTGTQLSVTEAIGRAVAATMLEPVPAVPPPLPGGTVPMRRSEAIRAGIGDMGTGEQIRISLRGVPTGSRSVAHGDRITIGRALECLIRVEGETATSVSRVHAEVSVVNGAISVRDGGSRHGTFVNGKKADGATPLKTGDQLMLGPGGPSFIVEEAAIVPVSAEPPPPPPPGRDASVGPTGVRNQGPSSSPAPPVPPQKPAAVRDEDGVFRSELPTPALDRPAARKPSSPPVRTPQPAIPRGRGPAMWGVLLLFTTVVATIIAVAVQKMDRTETPVMQTNANVQQQSAELDAMRVAAAGRAAGVRAALDSAIRSARPTAVIDSLRRSLAEADRQVAGLEESLKQRRARGGR